MEEDSLSPLPTAEDKTKEILQSYFRVNATGSTMNLDPYSKVVVILSL